MKKLSLLLVAFALVMGLSQCKKPKLPVFNGETQHVVLNASWDNGGSKIADNGDGGLKWEKDDKLTVSGGATGELTCTDAENGTFEGYITRTTGKIRFTFGNQNFMGQTGLLNGVVYLESPELDYKSDGDYGGVLMTMPYAVMKLDLSGFAATTKTGGTTVTISINGLVKASVANITSDSKAVYVAIPADETQSEKIYTFSGNGMVASASWKLGENTFYTLKDGEGAAIVIEPTAPVFSVAADRTVVFAPGNLWYDGSKFHFEDSQTAYIESWDKNHVSLFRWSPNKDLAVQTSTSIPEYTTSVYFFTNSDAWTAKSDFQVEGEVAGTWRTLSNNEWKYLLSIGDESKDARTDANRFAKAKVNGVNGLLIFPDKYNNGTAVSGITGVAEVNNKSAEYPSDNIPAETWTAMESCGVVFLPAAGSRDGTDFDNVNINGSYWASTKHDSKNARRLRISSSVVSMAGNLYKNGYSVRLVRGN